MSEIFNSLGPVRYVFELGTPIGMKLICKRMSSRADTLFLVWVKEYIAWNHLCSGSLVEWKIIPLHQCRMPQAHGVCLSEVC